MKKAEFVELITMIESFYPGRFKNDEVTAKNWWEILKDYEFALCKKNLTKHVQVGEWPPAIANLITGHKDSSRPYDQDLVETIEKVKPYEEIIKEIEQRTGRKVID